MGYVQTKKRQFFFDALKEKLGRSMARQIFAESDFRFEELMREYHGMSSEELTHIEVIVSQVAFYETFQKHMSKEDAYGIFRRVTHQTCEMVSKLGSFITFFPGGSRLVLKIMSSLEKDLFDSKQGFVKEVVTDNKDEFRFYVHKCPYFDYFNKYGYPELCSLACESDQWSYGSIKRFTMLQNGTLGFGQDKCDYTYRSDKYKDDAREVK